MMRVRVERRPLMSSLVMLLAFRVVIGLRDDFFDEEDPPENSVSHDLLSKVSKLTTESHDQNGFPYHVKLRREIADSLSQTPTSSDPIMETYATMYLREFSRRQSIFFLHVSKAGGTFLCMCGWSNKCRAPDGKTSKVASNCHGLEVEYHQLWMPRAFKSIPKKLSTCNGLAARHMEKKWTLAGDENYLVDGGPCPQFWNTIVLRDPVCRLISHLNMLVHGFVGFNPDNGLAIPRITADYVFRKYPLLSDNYLIRTLSGEDVYKLPFGKITREHLARAKSIIERFDTIFDLSSLSDELKLLGWSCLESSGREGAQKYHKDMNATKRTKFVLHKFAVQNALDQELYDHAMKLHDKDMRVLRNPSFVAKLVKEPNASCGFLKK
eukprot:TRINITY_DN357_c0_g1_i2.p1 TRINITY_DN357_c0_g1~~TRINITY_DN357_c0_g1_i2.p1  ORF type:complete len:381 (-),score=43.18 TRINITY_DN357_c0_g1_i2:156-1298(-)